MTNENKARPTFFADTSSIQELRELMGWGIFKGITTNPVIVAKEAPQSTDPLLYFREIATTFPDYPVSTQLVDSSDFEMTLEKARQYASLSPNVVIKVPMFANGQGIRIVNTLTREGIKVNVTALMTAEQAMFTMMGDICPTYVSLFYNRAKDGGEDPRKEIENTREFIDKLGLATKIIVGSIRSRADVREALVSGTHIVTIPPKIIFDSVNHPQSTKFIAQCADDWKKFQPSG